MLAQPWVTSVVAGAENAAQVDDTAALVHRPPLTAEEVAVVHDLVAPGPLALVDPSTWSLRWTSSTSPAPSPSSAAPPAGSGPAMVRALADAGATVVAVGRSPERLAEAVGEIPRVEFATCDITSAAWPALLGEVAERHGRLDVLVNNAHVPRGGSLRTATDEDYRLAFDLAVTASARAIEAARPALAVSAAAGGPAAVVNVSSMYGVVAPDLSIYAEESHRNPPFYGTAKAAMLQAHPVRRRRVRPRGHPGQRAGPRPLPRRAGHTRGGHAAGQDRRADPARPGRPAGGGDERAALPRLARLVLRHRLDCRGRRRLDRALSLTLAAVQLPNSLSRTGIHSRFGSCVAREAAEGELRRGRGRSRSPRQPGPPAPAAAPRRRSRR
ncbi:SDR family oxidoreductase [Nocardioides sp. W3-2-3]|nr:SDR family oxidoreductase [Nocardioides convexus]